MPLPPPEQVADEALAWRTADVDWAGRIARSASDGDEDAVTRARVIELARWAGKNPALDAIAEVRQQAIAELRDAGVTPDRGCAAESGDVHLDAVVTDVVLNHRYRLLRLVGGRWAVIGAAWLSTDPDIGAGRYVAHIDGATVYGDRLREALDRLAMAIAGAERRDREQHARTGRPS